MSLESGGPWEEGVWSEWADKAGIPLPGISPISNSDLVDLQIHKPVLLTRQNKESLEHEFSLTLAEYVGENDGRLPLWVRIYKNRLGDGRLTPKRDKKLAGYIIKKIDDSHYLDRIHEFFDSGGYILEPNGDMPYRKLANLGVSCVEKELLHSRKKRLLVFRLLDGKGEIIRMSSARWDNGVCRKKIRIEDRHSDGVWKVIKETTTNLEEDSQDLDRFVLSL